MFARTVRMQPKANCVAEFTSMIDQDFIPLLRKQQGFRDEITFVPTDGRDAVAVSLWEQKDEFLRAAGDHFEEDVRALVADFTVATTALRLEIGTSNNGGLSEARERLERWEGALRQASGQLMEHVSQSTAEFTSVSMALVRKIGEHEVAERKLEATNAQLRQEITERERLETERSEVERGLREVRERFESAFDNAPIGMALIGMDGRWLQANDALCRITGRAKNELKAKTLRAMTHPDDLDLDAQDLEQLLAGRIPSYQVEKRYRHASGHDVWVLVTALLVRDAKGNPLHAVTQVQDISERKELARHLEYLVDHDSLTGLFNRRHFEQELFKESERAARYGVSGAVFLIDLDNFKDVNDTFGHKSGDDVLKGVAGLLRERMRQTDVVARIGGDEFAVLLPQTDSDQAQIVADQLVKTLGRQTVVQADRSIRITASIGVAMLDGLTDTEVLAYADLAMYEAKAGRNRVAMYRRVKGHQPSVYRMKTPPSIDLRT